MLTAAGEWTDLGRGVRVRQSRAYRMNSVLMLARPHAVVVDPGVLPSELDELAAAVRDAKPKKVTLVLTHGHWDHVLGRPWWPGAPTVAHTRIASELQRDAERIAREAEAIAGRAGERWEQGFAPFEPELALNGAQTARLGSWVLAFREAPGHCDSQVVVHLAQRRLLLAADMLSDIEIPSLRAPVAVYRRTLESLRPLLDSGEVECLVPGHGAIAKGAEAVRARFDADFAYLDQLDRGIREARAARLGLERAQKQLEAMEYLGKHAEYSMAETHRANVKAAWEGIAAEGRG